MRLTHARNNTTKIIYHITREDYGIQVFPIVTIKDIMETLHNQPVDGKVYIDDEMKAKMEAYLAEYGAK